MEEKDEKNKIKKDGWCVKCELPLQQGYCVGCDAVESVVEKKKEDDEDDEYYERRRERR